MKLLVLSTLLFLTSCVQGHSGHAQSVTPDSSEPIDGILGAHMVLQLFTWGILLPAGMVLGLTKSRLHVPVQTLGILLTIIGVQLAHHHGGRTFYHTAHGTLAYFLTFYLFVQVACGIFLKLHVMESSKMRKYVLSVHSFFGKIFPILSWAQICMGIVAALGFCSNDAPPDDYMGQCVLHIIEGSSFQAYGIVLLLSFRLGGPWLAKRRLSQEYLDSWVIVVYGVFTAAVSHNGFGYFGHATHWSHKDMQHTAVGILFIFGGATGIWLSRNAKRNVIPAIVIGATGLAMSSHEQPTMLSTMTHRLFGLALGLFAVVRIVEISFLHHVEQDSIKPSPLQYLSPLLMITAGVTFASAHYEQLRWMDQLGLDHITYSLLIFSAAFVVFLWANMLLSLYATSGSNSAHEETEFPSLASLQRRFSRSSSMDKTVYASVPAMEGMRSP